MRKIETTISQLDDVLDELYESDALAESDYDPDEIAVDDDNTIILDGPEVTFPALGLVAVPGTMYSRDEEGELEPDWSLTLIYEIGKTPAEYLYYEQDGILVSLHNYMSSVKKKIDGVFDDYKCVIRA